MTSKENLSEDEIEILEWIDSLDYVLQEKGSERVITILRVLQEFAKKQGVEAPFSATTPYVNTIPKDQQPTYPGSREIERRIKSIIRWNAMAMVTRANKKSDGIGGHISTYASAATLWEVAFNHFFRGKDAEGGGDLVFFQGHASPGVYARAFLEGRLTADQLENFRRELKPGGGLSSYPHPWLMPNFWEFPTVSMGLTAIQAIYQARFARYLHDRGLADTSQKKVWAFLGDGEMDEPESLGSISLASREQLDNLIFVVNCNLQRLDGPVRGNFKIVQELEAQFRGAGWNVIKVLWGDDWDQLLTKDRDGALVRLLGDTVDGMFQKMAVEDGEYIRREFFGKDPRTAKLVEQLSDDQLERLRRGGHDPEKVYAAFHRATNHKGAPTVILAHTIKGYGLGEAGEGKNITHQQKKLNENELREFRTRFGIPISDAEVANAPFYKPPEDSEEIKYLLEQRRKLGGFVPERRVMADPLNSFDEDAFAEFYEGTSGRAVSTTMVFVRILTNLLKDKNIKNLLVPIIPDEARTFGMEALFRKIGIYSHVGQLYEPVDRENLLYYKEAKNGQILEEGITEAGAMSSFIAAGTAYATHGIMTVPFYIYYSMFGFQRVADLIWAAAEMRVKGFLIGATAGRTTLAGEGLQHQDGNSHVFALTVPNVKSYDPTYAYELAVIIKDGLRRMFVEMEDSFYYITVMNENYIQPPMPEGVEEGIIKGMYKFKAAEKGDKSKRVHLFGSGTILNEAVKAQTWLADLFNIAADVWSVTSYNELYREAEQVERWNLLNPTQEERTSYISDVLAEYEGEAFVAASDYIRALPNTVAKWIPGDYYTLGTDGFGRSEDRAGLRDFFEVDARYIVIAALKTLLRQGKVDKEVLDEAIEKTKVDADKPNPWVS